MTEPIRFSVHVPLGVVDAFELFTERMSSWWPLVSHSVYQERAARVEFEPFAGGNIVERSNDGEQNVWGEVLAYDAPHRLLFTWHPGTDVATEVEVTFRAEAEGTRVVLEHRKWEEWGALADDMREGYANGWPIVFVQRYGDAARAAREGG